MDDNELEAAVEAFRVVSQKMLDRQADEMRRIAHEVALAVIRDCGLIERCAEDE